MKQKITSKDTCLNQIPSVYNNYEFKEYSFVLDVGCGKYYNRIINDLATKNVIAAGYDPYNQNEELNELSLSLFNSKKPNYIVCSNVLNVIQEDECMEDVIRMINEYSDDDTLVIFKLHEGDKSGKGKVTTKGFQRNQKTADYLPFIDKYFSHKRNGKFIECRKVVCA